MKLLILILVLCPISVLADTTLSRDGNGQNIQGYAFSQIKSANLGTKGFKCFSTATKLSWEFKVTNGMDSTLIGFKYFLNGDESSIYPIIDKVFQWQNAPIFKSPTITKACMRAYSSNIQKVGYGIFQ